MAAVDGKDPWEAFASLRYELDRYQAGLSNKGTIIIANKMDLEPAKKNLGRFMKKLKSSKLYDNMLVYPTSTLNGVNVEPILLALKNIVEHGRDGKSTETFVPFQIKGDGYVTFDLAKLSK